MCLFIKWVLICSFLFLFFKFGLVILRIVDISFFFFLFDICCIVDFGVRVILIIVKLKNSILLLFVLLIFI